MASRWRCGITRAAPRPELEPGPRSRRRRWEGRALRVMPRFRGPHPLGVPGPGRAASGLDTGEGPPGHASGSLLLEASPQHCSAPRNPGLRPWPGGTSLLLRAASAWPRCQVPAPVTPSCDGLSATRACGSLCQLFPRLCASPIPPASGPPGAAGASRSTRTVSPPIRASRAPGAVTSAATAPLLPTAPPPALPCGCVLRPLGAQALCPGPAGPSRAPPGGRWGS